MTEPWEVTAGHRRRGVSAGLKAGRSPWAQEGSRAVPEPLKDVWVFLGTQSQASRDTVHRAVQVGSGVLSQEQSSSRWCRHVGCRVGAPPVH